MLLRSDVLVGRRQERATLEQVLAGAASGGRARLVLVEGDGGLGKTRLVSEVTGTVPDGVTVVRGAAYAGGSDVPLLPWAEALRDLVRQWGADPVAAAAGAAVPDFAVLLPELGAPDPDRPARVPDLMPWLWERLAERGPLVLVLEDLHAADPGSMAVLQRLSRYGRGRLTVVVTGRPDGDARDPEAARRWHDAAAELRRTEATAILLAPLPPQDSAELAGRLVARHVRARSGADAPAVSADMIETLASASGGVPFAMEQLAASHLAGRPVDGLPGDPGLASLPSVSPTTADVLAALSLHGAETDHELLVAIVGRSESDVVAAVHEAIDSGLVRVGGSGHYQVSHALVSEQVRATLLPVQRRRWHARVAAALQERLGDRRSVAALPAHYEAAGDAPAALVAAVRAAEDASYAPDVAARHYARAVALWAAVDDAGELTGTSYDNLLELAATRCAEAGDVEAAVELARGWLGGEGAAQDPARASRLALLIAARGEWVLPADEVMAAFSEAVEQAERAGGQNLSAALTGLARHLAALDRNDEAEPLARRALQVADPAAAVEVPYARATLGSILAHLGDHDAGAEQLRSALSGMHPRDNAQEHARTMFELVWTEYYAGRAVAARDLALETVQALGGAGLVFDIRASLLGAAAQIEVWLGRWVQARRLIERGEREDPAGLGRASRLLAEGELALRLGRVEPARAALAACVGHWEALGLREFDHVGLNASAEAAAAAGDLPAAHGFVREGLASIVAADTVYELATVARGAGLVVAATRSAGQEPPSDLVSGAAELVARIERCERLGTGSVPHAELLTARAGIASAQGEASSPLWAVAADAWAALGFPWWENSCRLSYAEALLRSRGARGKASEVVRDARQAARKLGAEGLLAAADRLAASAGLVLADPTEGAGTGSTTPSEAGSPLSTLTAREREVVALLVEGRSNREIARRLFISEKTASVHVSNILAKLGVSSRLQAATLVRDLGRDIGRAPR